jgi:hypothetical protein
VTRRNLLTSCTENIELTITPVRGRKMKNKHLHYDKEAGCWRRRKDSASAHELKRLSNDAYDYIIGQDEDQYFVFCMRRVEPEDWIGVEISQAEALRLTPIGKEAAIREIRRTFYAEGLFI